jgi:hypothetical protein
MSNIPPTVNMPSASPPPPPGSQGGPPPGPPPGPPGGFGGPPAGGQSFNRNHVYAIGAAIVLLIAAIGGVLILRSDDASADEVFLEPVGSTGDNPFTSSVDVDTDVDVQQAIDANARASASTGVQTFDGGQPGLYGGTQNSRHCDKAQLVTFLESNPDKAGAWAAVQGITAAQIPDYVADLTPILLREDTRVTNHGFVSSTANPIPAVLQAGTAVLVDRFGRPVVKCACGNPLTAPSPASSPRYTGPRWSGFSGTTITVIQQTTIEIDVFVLTDPVSGDQFERPAGTDGDQDTPIDDEQPPVTQPPVTQPPVTQPPVTQAPVDEDAVLAMFNAADQACTDRGVEYPFDDAETIDSTEVLPTSDPNVFEVQLDRTTAAGEAQFFSFFIDTSTGDITPNSDLARQAAAACPEFG